MKEYSLENSDFKKISLAQIKALFDVLVSSHDHSTSYIKDRFLRSSQNFDETFNFIASLNIAKNTDGKIQLLIPINGAAESIIVKSILKRTNNIKAIASYLGNFSPKNGVYRFKPAVQKNLHTSGIRNLLLELDIIEHDLPNREYVLNKKGIAYMKKNPHPTSAFQFEKILQKRNELGLEAELQVLLYEKKRLIKKHPELVEKIVHTSRLDSGAGYDIQSFSLLNKKISPKYIEVKAVSINNLNFFWSINEVKTAKKYGASYYLYLVPITKSKKPDTRKLRIIPNPYKNIYKNNSARDLEAVLFNISLKN